MHSECAPPATEASPGARRAPRRRARTATASAQAPTPAPVSLSCDSSLPQYHLRAVYFAFKGFCAVYGSYYIGGQRVVRALARSGWAARCVIADRPAAATPHPPPQDLARAASSSRSEERRVGKEWRSRWARNK